LQVQYESEEKTELKFKREVFNDCRSKEKAATAATGAARK
jgi:hypothetical protein